MPVAICSLEAAICALAALAFNLLLLDRITDVDGAAEGIAVIGVDNSNGQWQYNTGSGWTSFGAVSGTSAVLFVESTFGRVSMAVVAAAVVVLLLGPERIDRLVKWWLALPDPVLRLSMAFAAAFGVFLVYVAT